MEKLKDVQKKEAVERMEKLELLPMCISEFKENGKTMLSMGGILYNLNSTYQKMIDEWQEQTGNLVSEAVPAPGGVHRDHPERQARIPGWGCGSVLPVLHVRAVSGADPEPPDAL